jgi:hypothetical protein
MSFERRIERFAGQNVFADAFMCDIGQLSRSDFYSHFICASQYNHDLAYAH